jgi:hypothetical protein
MQAQRFEAEAVSGAFDRLEDAVIEHSSWLAANCEAQVREKERHP